MKQFGGGDKGRLPKLGPIVGAPPKESSHARGDRHTQPLRHSEPLAGDHHMTAEAWRALVKVESTHRIFFTSGGEEEEEEEGDVSEGDRLSEIEGVKMPARFWRHKPSGHAVSIHNL